MIRAGRIGGTRTGPTRDAYDTVLLPMADARIYHVCRREEWRNAESSGLYVGSTQDVADGFIHFSSAAQIVESVARHRAGQDGLVIIEVDSARLGDGLRWEASRRGDLFPHVYGKLALTSVVRVAALPLGADGRHVFPWGLAA